MKFTVRKDRNLYAPSVIGGGAFKVVENLQDADTRIAFQLYTSSSQQFLSKIYQRVAMRLCDGVFLSCQFLKAMQPSACYMSYFYQVKNYLKNYPKLIWLSKLIEIPSHVLTPAVHAVESERISIRWTILGILRDFTMPTCSRLSDNTFQDC